MHGDNIGNIVQFMEREHKNLFKSILASIISKISGIKNIGNKITNDKNVFLYRYYLYNR